MLIHVATCTNLRIFLLSRGGAGRRDELIQGPTGEEPRKGNSKQTEQESDCLQLGQGTEADCNSTGSLMEGSRISS